MGGRLGLKQKIASRELVRNRGAFFVILAVNRLVTRSDSRFDPQGTEPRTDTCYSVTEEQLAALFCGYGHVLDCRVCGDHIHASDSARAALNLCGTMLGFSQITVLPSKTAILHVHPTSLPRACHLEQRGQFWHKLGFVFGPNQASVAGYVCGQYQLALCLHRGIGTDQNLSEAARWYLRAAEGGYAEGFCKTMDNQENVFCFVFIMRLLYFDTQEGHMMKAVVYLELAGRGGETAATHWPLLLEVLDSRDNSLFLWRFDKCMHLVEKDAHINAMGELRKLNTIDVNKLKFFFHAFMLLMEILVTSDFCRYISAPLRRNLRTSISAHRGKMDFRNNGLQNVPKSKPALP
ncbi:ataxin-2, Nucleotide-binding alpha-beta plait domain protein [Artemisia annua]|uniref:Ataxin-2, Nucleotide-binding alpha-beta plait domain protein n=1 Tax=Artemisia annua TaxID=35608 RepID=A0A2U1PSH5_ARTAN|nr:ataxin-2, Nucleotide-binding alpha-beta plait domain protein [Artemisia annua]